ncbi:PF20097 family protein [Tepidanaerobacter acetatoxydans]|uniref:PF20097 family protein n=1 Tax=Tepidanaerobacter acetatoxydans TaxID=499229 RepID=UPI0002DDDC92
MTTQTCPYCGNPLEEGTLRSRGGNFYLPAGESVPILYSKQAMNKKGAIRLAPNFLSLAPQWPHAYVCRNCKIIIILYED